MDLSVIAANASELASGALVTVELTAISILIGLALAVPLGLARLARNPLLWMPVYGYILYFRGTPLLVQIFLIYYGSGQFRDFFESVGLWVFFREAYFCAILSLTLNTAGYTAEILRGAIRAVPHGEIEAARACGYSGVLLYRRIILPKAFRLAPPAYGNEVIFLLQASSLVSIITVLDLTGIAGRIVAKTFVVYETYIVAALIYLAMSYTLVFVFRKLEFRWSAHLRESTRGPAALLRV